MGRDQRAGVVVLTYHSVLDAQREKFEEQMDMLLKTGDAVFADSAPRPSAGRRLIAVTFDDGYRNILRNAMPALRARGIPSILFMTTKYMGESPGWIHDRNNPNRSESLISGEQLMSLQGELVKIGSHTHSHAFLGLVDRDTLLGELIVSKKVLERILSSEVHLLSLPYGSMDEDTLNCSETAGYRVVFVNVPYPVSAKGGLRIVGRTHVSMDDWGIEYLLKLRGAYDWARHTYGLKKKLRRVFLTRSGREKTSSPSIEDA